MSDPIIEMSKNGWIADHRNEYKSDPKKGHMWDSSPVGGPGLLPTLLLTTVGRKSGNESVMPLIYGEHAGGYVVVASKGGAPKNPGWYHNMVAQDKVKVQVADDEFDATVRELDGEERTQVWDEMAKLYPPYIDYQAKTERQIPVLLLERA